MAWAATRAATRCAPPRRRPARARRWSSTRRTIRCPKGRPARPAAEHVPGLRLAARRPAHAPHRDHPVGLGLLRLRPDLHLALLRRAPQRRLRAVQLRDRWSPASCSRTSARRCTAGRPGAVRRHRHHQPVRADRQRRAAAAAAEGDQRRAHHRHRRAGLRRADACRGQGRAGRRDAEVRAQRGRGRPGAGAARRRRRASRPSRCSARCSRPTRWASA